MTKKRLQKLVEKNLRKNPNSMIDTETGLEALERVVAVAGREFWALVAAGLKRWYDLADGRITTEKDDSEADRI